MTNKQLKDIVFRVVGEYGPVKAGEILRERCAIDDEFKMACAEHGWEVVCAIDQSQTATKH